MPEWFDFYVGQRVQARPGTDTWTRGDRYGTIIYISPHSHLITVKMDKSGKHIVFSAPNLLPIE